MGQSTQRGLGKSEVLLAVGSWLVLLGPVTAPTLDPQLYSLLAEPSCPTEQQAKATWSPLQPSVCPRGSESGVKGLAVTENQNESTFSGNCLFWAQSVPSLSSLRLASLFEVLAVHESVFVGLQGALVPLCHPLDVFMPRVITSRSSSADATAGAPPRCPVLAFLTVLLAWVVGGQFSLGQ